MDKQQSLPIASRREEILAAVRNHDVVVITAETGAGKSTQVPQYLLEAGYQVVVTQPRRLAARTVAERVAEEVGTELGDLVGFRTAQERADSNETKVLFCTDGPQLVRELTGQGAQVLVIDEVHEWNLNIEVLTAWARRQVAEHAGFKVVLMSATLEAERLAEYFGGCPIIRVSGRTYPVEIRRPSSFTEQDAIRQIVQLSENEGRNVLVFMPGKSEIREVAHRIDQLVQSALDARMNARRLSQTPGIDPEARAHYEALAEEPVWNPEVIALHGELTPAEQKRAFLPSITGRPKVVIATNVAQTSVTIPDIDAVVDSGEERRTEVRDGVEGLYLAAISQADCHQRAGRAGRTKPGVYVLCSDLPVDRRPEYPTAEIERSRLDQMVLRLAIAGLDATELEFFHQPDREALVEAKAALGRLGAFDEHGQVTKIGRKMSRLPVDVHLARMVVEAQRRGVLDDVLTIAACLEAGGIRDRTGMWRTLTQERESDLLAELDVYHAAHKLRDRELRDAGIFAKAYHRAREIRRSLSRAVQTQPGPRKGKHTGDRTEVLRACVAGMVDHLYRHEYGAAFRNGDDSYRELARESVLNGTAGIEWITGQPFDLQTKGRRGVLHLITFASKVDPRWLAEVAPQLVSTLTRNCRYSDEHERVVVDHVTVFNGQETTIDPIPAPHEYRVEATDALGWALVRGETGHPAEAHNAQVRATLADLHARSDGRVQPLGDQPLHAFYVQRIGQATSLAEIAGLQLMLEFDAYAPQGLRAEIDRDAPRTIRVLGRELDVVYRAGYDPTVTLPADLVDAGGWRELPDEGVRLPGSRMVRVELRVGYYTTYSEVDGAVLKQQVREHLNREQFSDWYPRPELALPRVTDETAEIPPIEEATYGSDALTGQPLIAYGTAVVNPHRYYNSDPLLRSDWYRTREEADTARERVIAELERRREQLLEQQRLEQAITNAEAVARQVEAIAYGRDSHELPDELREKLHGRYYLPTRSDLGRLESWTAETEALLAEAQAAIAELEQQREQHRRQLDEARQTLQALQREAQELLDEYGDDLDPDSCDELYRLITEPAACTLHELADQAHEVREAITAAEDILTRPSDPATESGWNSANDQQAAIAALADKFNRK